MGAACAATIALGICLGAGFLVGAPFTVLDRPAFLADLDAQRVIASGQGHGGSIIDPARAVYSGVRGWTHHVTVSLRYGLGLLLLIASLVGAGRLVIEQPQRAALVLSFPLAF